MFKINYLCDFLFGFFLLLLQGGIYSLFLLLGAGRRFGLSSRTVPGWRPSLALDYSPQPRLAPCVWRAGYRQPALLW